jgi:hypothetical protein
VAIGLVLFGLFLFVSIVLVIQRVGTRDMATSPMSVGWKMGKRGYFEPKIELEKLHSKRVEKIPSAGTFINLSGVEIPHLPIEIRRTGVVPIQFSGSSLETSVFYTSGNDVIQITPGQV